MSQTTHHSIIFIPFKPIPIKLTIFVLVCYKNEIQPETNATLSLYHGEELIEDASKENQGSEVDFIDGEDSGITTIDKDLPLEIESRNLRKTKKKYKKGKRKKGKRDKSYKDYYNYDYNDDYDYDYNDADYFAKDYGTNYNCDYRDCYSSCWDKPCKKLCKKLCKRSENHEIKG